MPRRLRGSVVSAAAASGSGADTNRPAVQKGEQPRAPQYLAARGHSAPAPPRASGALSQAPRPGQTAAPAATDRSGDRARCPGNTANSDTPSGYGARLPHAPSKP